MDPLCDYYLCTRNGETDIVAALVAGDGALDGYEDVQKLEYWQALQWVEALWELERALDQDDDLRSMLIFRVGGRGHREWLVLRAVLAGPELA